MYAYLTNTVNMCEAIERKSIWAILHQRHQPSSHASPLHGAREVQSDIADRTLLDMDRDGGDRRVISPFGIASVLIADDGDSVDSST